MTSGAKPAEKRKMDTAALKALRHPKPELFNFLADA